MGWTAWARRMVPTHASESPTWRILPSSTSSASAPTVSSIGVFGVDPVLVVEVDVVGAETPERALNGGADIGRTAVEMARAVPGVRDHAELRGEHDLVTTTLDRLADQLLIGEGAVDLGGVDEGDPETSARWMVRIDSASSVPAPVNAVDIPMAPSPMRPTSRVPSVACFMIALPFVVFSRSCQASEVGPRSAVRTGATGSDGFRRARLASMNPVRGLAWRDRAPTRHTLAITIGTATKATYSETCPTPMWGVTAVADSYAAG